MRDEVSSCFTIRSRRHLLFFIRRPDLESVRGSGEGDSSPGVSNSFVSLLDGDGLDEIYHVIELVLVGLDP